jgi:hypothetical protein
VTRRQASVVAGAAGSEVRRKLNREGAAPVALFRGSLLGAVILLATVKLTDRGALR